MYSGTDRGQWGNVCVNSIHLQGGENAMMITLFNFFIYLMVIVLILSITDKIYWSTRIYKFKTRLLCKLFGHDYHDGQAENLVTGKIRDDGDYDYFRYDYCQRCNTMQNVAPTENPMPNVEELL